MANGTDQPTPAATEGKPSANPPKDPGSKAVALPAAEQMSDVLEQLPDSVFDRKTHVGIAITIIASGKRTTLMIPDATSVGKGEPIYTTGRIKISGQALKEMLTDLPEPLARLLNDAHLDCDAFYYAKVSKVDGKEPGPMLLSLSLNFDNGVIGDLIGDPKIGRLFDITGGSVRVVRCGEQDRGVLESYVKLIQQNS